MPIHPEGLNLAAWLREEPFTLAMSSGFFGFFAHCGVLWALEEAGLVPARVRGSSAGALITGLWAAGLSAREVAADLATLTRADFWDPRPGFGFLAGRLFDQRLRRMLPVDRFEACRVPISVSIFDVKAARTRVVSTGDLAPALRASCAVPFMFHPVMVDKRPSLDGGIRDRSSLEHAPHGERTLYHHLVSSSPWRRKKGRWSALPHENGRHSVLSLVVPGLPRVTPYRLELGQTALEHARSHVRSLLASPFRP